MRRNHVSFGDILLYNTDIANEMNNVLDASWRSQYGLEITDVSLADLNLPEESMHRVSKVDDAMIFSNANLQSGLMASATADAMKAAASNEAGAMTGFMGMGFAQNMGATAMGAVNQTPVQAPSFASETPQPGAIFGTPSPVQPQAPVQPEQPAMQTPVQPEQPQQEVVTEEVQTQENEVPEVKVKFCSNCGAKVTGNFCTECGTKAE